MEEPHSNELTLQGEAHVSWRKNQIKMGKLCNKTKAPGIWEFRQGDAGGSRFSREKNKMIGCPVIGVSVR